MNYMNISVYLGGGGGGKIEFEILLGGGDVQGFYVAI